MAADRTVAVLGGYGVFGQQICRALAERGLRVVVAGRDLDRARAFAASLGPAHGAMAADAAAPESLAPLLAGADVGVCAAGPFAAIGDAWIDASVAAGCASVDIADDRVWVQRLLARDAELAERGLAAVVGASSLPGLSGALALAARRGRADPPELARVTLFIGNDNPKGGAAVRSAQSLIGKSITAPQGRLRGFGDREVVELPAPFGRRAVYTFESPEYDLFPRLLGVGAVRVKVGFELRAATSTFALLSRLGIGTGPRTGRVLARVGGLARGLGCSGGAVLVELYWPDGAVERACLHSPVDGQRMAALPAAIAAATLSGGGLAFRGVRTVYDALGAGALLAELAAAGFTLTAPSP